MVSSKKLIATARKWQRVAAFSRKLLSTQKTDAYQDSDACCSTQVASKGHFTVYSVDQKRFMIPLSYLQSSIFVELFKLSEDEFGLPSDGPITLPCDAAFMEYILSSIRRRGSKATDRELLDSVYKHQYSTFSSQLVELNQRVVYSF